MRGCDNFFILHGFDGETFVAFFLFVGTVGVEMQEMEERHGFLARFVRKVYFDLNLEFSPPRLRDFKRWFLDCYTTHISTHNLKQQSASGNVERRT